MNDECTSCNVYLIECFYFYFILLKGTLYLGTSQENAMTETCPNLR